jgi:hypothetical protein
MFVINPRQARIYASHAMPPQNQNGLGFPCGNHAARQAKETEMTKSNSEPGGGFSGLDNKPIKEVPAGTIVRNPGTGQTGRADGNGGVFKDKTS